MLSTLQPMANVRLECPKCGSYVAITVWNVIPARPERCQGCGSLIFDFQLTYRVMGPRMAANMALRKRLEWSASYGAIHDALMQASDTGRLAPPTKKLREA